MSEFTLQKITRLPDACSSTWRLSDNSIEEHPLSLEDYKALALSGAGSPENPTGDKNAVWMHAGSRAIFDTPDGKLAPGDVCEWGHGDDWCNGPSNITLVIGTPEGNKILEITNDDIFEGSKDTVSLLSIADTRCPGLTIVKGKMIIEDK